MTRIITPCWPKLLDAMVSLADGVERHAAHLLKVNPPHGGG
jgi:hypothetical protein